MLLEAIPRNISASNNRAIRFSDILLKQFVYMHIILQMLLSELEALKKKGVVSL